MFTLCNSTSPVSFSLAWPGNPISKAFLKKLLISFSGSLPSSLLFSAFGSAISIGTTSSGTLVGRSLALTSSANCNSEFLFCCGQMKYKQQQKHAPSVARKTFTMTLTIFSSFLDRSSIQLGI